MNKEVIVETTVKASIDRVWRAWTEPEHIMEWNYASSDWECPYAENDVRTGGKFLSRMSAKDGSASFDFTGEYTEVEPHSFIAYTMDDGRKARVTFEPVREGVRIIETFEMEDENSEELQRSGWQAILENFRAHAEKVA